MENKAEYAVDCFNSGFNCTQSVFTAFCEDFRLDRKLALKLSCSLGAGIGYLGEVCGAVTGAMMALSLKYGQDTEGDGHAKAMTYLLDRDFASRFRKLNGSINCRELINVDLNDENQRQAAGQSGVYKTKCTKYVRDAVEIVEIMFKEY